MTIEAKFRVNPRRMSAIEQRTTPAAMYGLLRPKRDFELSAMTPARQSAKYGDEERRPIPMRGWTMRPERGPAMKTRDIRDLERPREMRYGEAARHRRSVLYNARVGIAFLTAHRRPFR